MKQSYEHGVSMRNNDIQGTVFYTLPELSERLGIGILTLRKYVRGGRLKAKRIGKSYYVLDSSLREFLSPDERATERTGLTSACE